MLDFWIHDFVFPFLKIDDDRRQDKLPDGTQEERDIIESLKPNNEKVKTKEEEQEEAERKKAAEEENKAAE